MPYVMSPTYYFAYLQLCISSVLLTRVPLFLLNGLRESRFVLDKYQGRNARP